MVSYLLDARANPGATDNAGLTPLQCAHPAVAGIIERAVAERRGHAQTGKGSELSQPRTTQTGKKGKKGRKGGKGQGQGKKGQKGPGVAAEERGRESVLEAIDADMEAIEAESSGMEGSWSPVLPRYSESPTQFTP